MITSTANPRIKAAAALKDRNRRTAEERFPIEGARVAARALAAEWPLLEAFYAPGLADAEATAVCDRLRASGVPVTEVGDAAFAKMAYRRHPDGLLAIGATRPLPLADVPISGEPLLLVVEAIEKPGNLGAMLRTADGAGADAIIAAGRGTDPFNPNVVRASQGALFTIPLAVASPTETRTWLQNHGIAVYAARPHGGPAPWRRTLTGGVAVVVGSEHAGLSPAWQGVEPITLPMAGSGDSLNAATAAAVLLYEAVRQRSG